MGRASAGVAPAAAKIASPNAIGENVFMIRLHFGYCSIAFSDQLRLAVEVFGSLVTDLRRRGDGTPRPRTDGDRKTTGLFLAADGQRLIPDHVLMSTN
jgi:hypothetical protein